MTPAETFVLALYFFVLVILAVYGWHRYYLVYLYMKHKDQKPTLANRIGFHKGAGISYCLILNGTLTYMTDTQETVVRSGDLIVERSTLHSWRNEGTTPVSMLIVTVSAT